ncbi:uncharacterized protein F4817DRAFT_351934 [Daldinia loculata]|uniref:uncharacterized protein n=1 Tax=Daldinia loculata TaxID=103429 RepID=UPI0020C4DEDB|nr:uncharacterized protein F4817DRAFT_351934 [Daldinia loculata]KAI1642797.1 hypothetical protein F4817DRAFT_351934 [Daldinia loculata]
MASSQYSSLNPLQQYNQLSFAVISEHQHQQHQHQQPQHQSQHQHHPNSNPHPHPHSQPQPQLQLQSRPHQQQQQQQQHHLHQPAPTHTPPIVAQTYQHPPTLPSTTNIITQPQQQQQQQQQQHNINTNVDSDSSPDTTPLSTTPVVNHSATSNANPTSFGPPQRKRRRVGRPPKSQLERDYLDQRASNNLTPPQQPPPPQVHSPHPLNKGPYNSAEDAVFSLQLHVFTSGYGVSQKRTVKEKLPSGRYDPDGDVIRKDFACDRGGADFVSQSTGERRRESKKCGCGWKAVVRRLKREGDLWFIDIIEPNHNHPFTPPDQMHTIASYRRWQRENNAGIRTAIARLARAAAMPARQVADYLKGQFADPDLARIDRHILRALSMSDVDMPGGDAQQSQTLFDVVARRPTIILQENTGEGGGNGNPSGGAVTGVPIGVGVNPAGTPNRYQ